MSNPLLNLSESIAAAVEAVAPSLVRVQSGRRVASGLVWGDRLVVTVARALSRKHAPQVTLHDGTVVEATVVGRDPSLDLALLTVEAEGLAPVTRSSTDPKVGHIVLALGRPGSGPRVSLGLMAGVGGAWTTSDGGRVDAYWDVDGALPGGFSGGPLVDAHGAVLGVNTAALVRGGTTLPASTIDATVEALQAHGDRSPGFLGVLFQPAKLDEGQAELAGQNGALLITGLKRGGPAEAGGLLVGDLLIGYGEHSIAGWDDLAQALAGESGKAGQARVLRGGEVRSLDVTIAERTRRCR